MGNQLIWDDRFNIGIEIIDKEHKKLFKIIKKLFTANENEIKSQWFCQEGIKYFKEHAVRHFSEEEEYMSSIGYKDLEMHRRLHEDFRLRTLPSLERELEKTDYDKDAISHFLGVCAGWLIGHTLTEDHAIAGNEETKWSDFLPEEEQEAVKETIRRLLHDMFQLDAQAVSECYGGERFGNGIYYRLIYADKSGSKREIILIFEEKLLSATVGKLIGSRSSKIDVTLLNAARYTAMQFTERIKKHFSNSDQYTIKSEHLLTYEQFHQTIEKEHLRYSLLYDTGEGYFAFCCMRPQQEKEINGTFVNTENEMTQVKKYLWINEQENSSGKKKLLIVDDSAAIRYAMKKLLQNDYQTSLAGSGLSAIRCITLDRPDLILLDYDMPVCDGAQILKMIRAETAFADIPVFFLTGKVDKASVNRVLPLKPDGYLLKSAKLLDIKKNIDRYFEHSFA